MLYQTISNHESLASMMAMPIMVVSSVKAVNTRKVAGYSQIRERTIIYEGSSGPRELLESIVIQASAAVRGLEGPKPAEPNPEEMTEEQKRALWTDTKGKGKAKAPAVNGSGPQASHENKRLLEFCHRIITTAAAIDRSLRETKGDTFLTRLKASLPKVPTSIVDPNSTGGLERTVNPGMSDEEIEKIYVEWAKRVRFEYCDLTVPPPGGTKIDDDYSPVFKHNFSQEARMLVNADIPKRALAIAKEVCSLISTSYAHCALMILVS